MAGEIIRLGDSTSHGGKVLEGSQTDICHGKPIAFVGHKTHCPQCKGDYPIVEGVLTSTIYGKGVAVAGMKTACGATLIPTQFLDTVEWSSGAAAAAPAPAPAPAQQEAPAAPPAAEPPAEQPQTSAVKINRNELGFTDDQILNGKPKPSEWFVMSTTPATKRIWITAHVKFNTSTLDAAQAEKLKQLFKDGVSKFWSRSVELNGETYVVQTNVVEDEKGQPIRLKNTNRQERSYNTNGTMFLLSIFGSTVFYDKVAERDGGVDYADRAFQVTSAHEFGHPVLGQAGGAFYSWGHHGTSTFWGGDNGKKAVAPKFGELDLMKYYDNLPSDDMFFNGKASESDVKNLIYISHRN